MSIFLVSTNDALLRRWQSLLGKSGPGRTFQSAEEVGKILTDQSDAVIFLHRQSMNQAAIMALRQKGPRSRIFVLSDLPQPVEGVAMLKLGVNGYANAYMSGPKLLAALQSIESGGVWIGRQLLQYLITGSAQTGDNQGANEEIFATLTAREKEITEKVAQGLSNSDIAKLLAISERTVKAHLTAIYEKTGTTSRLQLALRARNPKKSE
ncbi:MAG: response regulator transcription factor [Thermodesulfobacteriota bacterium]